MRILWNWHVQFICFFFLRLFYCSLRSLYFPEPDALVCGCWQKKTKFAAINGLGNKYDGRISLRWKRSLSFIYFLSLFFSLFLSLYSPLSDWVNVSVCARVFLFVSHQNRHQIERAHKLLLSLENVSFFIFFSTTLRFGCHKLRWRLFFSLSTFAHRKSIVPRTIYI